MTRKRAIPKPRSPATDAVFEEFVMALRAQPSIGEAVAERMQAALSLGQTITGPKFQKALFPAKQSVAK